VLLLMAAPALAGDVETALLVAPTVAIDLRHDRQAEDEVEAWTRLDASATGESRDGRWRLSLRAEHLVRIGREEDGGDTEADWWVAAGESGWEGPVGPFRLRAGHLVERWGRLDLVPALDVLNGRDLRAGPFTPPTWQRVPTPMVRVQYGGTSARFEAIALPFGAADSAALWGTDWSLMKQGMVAGLAADAATWDGDALTEGATQDLASALATGLADLDPQLRQGLNQGLSRGGRPRPLDESLDLGGRLEVDGEGWDGAVVGAWLRNRQPAPVLDPALVAFLKNERLPGIADQETLLAMAEDPATVRWPRSWFAGVEAGTTLGPFGLRGEAGGWSARTVSRRWLQATTSPLVSAGIGADWAPSTSTIVAVEARWDRLLSPPDDITMMAPDDVVLGLLARTALARERVSLTLGGQLDLAFLEAVIRPEVRWRINDAVALSLGGAVLTGGPAAPTTFQEAMAHTGGPASYWGDADAASATLEWIQ
jgi:hypothetical protein